LIYLLYALHIIVCVFLILVVLLQQGKSADLSVFGGASTQAAFGARGAATLLHKLTVASFVGFILTTMGIALMLGLGGGDSVIGEDEEVSAPAPAAPAPLPEVGETAAPEPEAAPEAQAPAGETVPETPATEPPPAEGDSP
jgi:preprotein translocase subunit SecG